MRYDELAVSGPGADSRVAIDDRGRLDMYIDIKGDLRERQLDEDMPDDYAPEVREYAVDQEGAECPPLSIVIFVVGSRGESSSRRSPLLRDEEIVITTESRRRSTLHLFSSQAYRDKRSYCPDCIARRIQGLCSKRKQTARRQIRQGRRTLGREIVVL